MAELGPGVAGDTLALSARTHCDGFTEADYTGGVTVCVGVG